MTQCGKLCAIDLAASSLDSFVQVHAVGPATALSASHGSVVAVGCADGVLRLFSARDLAFVRSLPLPLALGSADLLTKTPTRAGAATPMVASPAVSSGTGVLYPAVTAVGVTRGGARVVVTYSDRSLFVWDGVGEGGGPDLGAQLPKCVCTLTRNVPFLRLVVFVLHLGTRFCFTLCAFV